MFAVSLPSATSLAELQATVEFIRTISTADGLAGALKQVSDARAALDARAGEVQTASIALDEKAASVEKYRASAQEVIDRADAIRTQHAADKQELADREKAFADKIDATNAEFNQTRQELQASADLLKKREDLTKEKQAEAQKAIDEASAAKAEYDRLIAKVKNAVG